MAIGPDGEEVDVFNLTREQEAKYCPVSVDLIRDLLRLHDAGAFPEPKVPRIEMVEPQDREGRR
jgi:hypothetical protein